MRIAFNGSIIDAISSGLGVYAINVARELVRLHENVIVYTSIAQLPGVKAANARKVSDRVQPRWGRKGHLQRLIWLQTMLPGRLLLDKANLLYCPLPEAILFPLIPQVVVVHDVLPLHFPEEYPRQQYYFRHFVPMILRRSRTVIADSESTKRDVISCYGIDPNKICVIPAGYDQRLFHPNVDAKIVKTKYALDQYILHVGNLQPHKNLRRLITAFSVIAPRCRHKLVIVGTKDPRYYPALERLVSTLGLNERVIFLDYIPLHDLPAVYSGAGLLVLSSLYEGFGLPSLEAMACCCPLVVSKVASLPEVCGEAAYYVDPRQTDSIAEGIYKVLADGNLRARLIRSGSERVQLYSWEKTAKETLRVLDKAINAGGMDAKKKGANYRNHRTRRGLSC